jgi:uncharacterized repeat protein (TIGR01451 family)
MKTCKSLAIRLIAMALVIFSGFASAQTVYGLFGLPAADIGKKQIGTLEPASGNVALLGSSSAIDPGQVSTITGATAVAVDAGLLYFIGRDAVNIDYIYTVDLATGLLVTRQAFSAGAPAPVSTLTASNTVGVWYDEPAQVLYALFIAPGGDREVVSIDPSTGVTVSVSGAIAGEAITTAGGVFTGDSSGERVFFIGTPASDDAQLYTVSTADGSFIQVPLQDYDQNSVQGIEWDSSNDILWAIVHGRSGERQLAIIDVDAGEVLANYDPLDNGDPITTSTGLIALEKATQKLFFIGRNNSNIWSIYTVDLADGSGTSQPIDNSNIQTNGYAGIEVVPGPELSLTKDDGGVSAVPGDTVSYTLTASNAVGTGTSTVTELVETVPANSAFNAAASTAGWNCVPDASAGSTCTLSLPDLASGDSNVSTFAVDVNASVSAGTTQISNSATLQAFNSLTSAMASDTTPISSAAALTLDKSDGDVSAVPGDTIVYTLTVGNSGNQDTANLVLSETVPAETTFNVAGSSAGWNCLPDSSAGSACTLTLSALAGGNQTAIAFAVDVDNPVSAGVTTVQNDASAIADNASGVNASDSTPITAAPLVAVSISDGGLSAVPGDVVVYQIDYANNGNQDADAVTLSVALPAQTVFVSGASTPGWVCGPGPMVSCDLSIGTVDGGGAGSSASFAVQIDDPVVAGTTQVSIDVSMTPGNGAADMASDTTPVTAAPDLVLYKSDGDISTVPGERISYALIAVNEGNMNAASTLLTETVPANTQFDPVNSSPDWVCVPDGSPGSTCTADLATLPGSTFEVRLFAVRVNNPVAPGTTSISNGASLTAENSSGSSEASDETPVDVRLDLIASKADGGVTAIAGQMLSYTLGYANGGTQNASGVVLNETVPVNTTFSSALSTAGWSCPDQAPAGTPCTLAIGSLAVGAQGSAMFAVKVDNPLPGGVTLLSNTVTVSDDGNAGSEDTPADNMASTSTPVVAALLDLGVSKVGALDEIAGVVDYQITVENFGNVPDIGGQLDDALNDPAFDSAGAAWDCVATGGASCPSSGTGPIHASVSLPVGSSLTVFLSVHVLPGNTSEEIFNTATITPSTPGSDVNLLNNSDTSRVVICLFCDGFEFLGP